MNNPFPSAPDLASVELTPDSPAAIKAMVREKYAVIATQSKGDNEASCCGATSAWCGPDGEGQDYTVFSEDYAHLAGYDAGADLGLGCGLPTAFAHIKAGDTVVDLGSGAGNDCFVARAETGETGRVIGVDFTPAMIVKARENATRLGYGNVEFREGEIENLPLGKGVADVVVSNCVLNLVPDKQAAFNEVYRVLKPGGHFSISDVVTKGALPPHLKKAAEMYAGCVSGGITMDEYLEVVEKAGFTDVKVQKMRAVAMPLDTLKTYLPEDQAKAFGTGEEGIYSVTVFARKPDTDACCKPGTGCC